jgi:molybdopterin-guanine dinucleotide biosynthesis protein A
MHVEASDSSVIPAILLAGGRATRLGGGDKCLRELGGRPLLDRVMDVLRPQTGKLVLNANGDPARFAAFGLPVVADDLPDHPGPLAGILAGLDWVAAHHAESPFALSVSTDCPFLPADLVTRFAAAQAAGDADIVLAESLGRLHPVIGLWRVALRADLRHALTQEGIRKVERFCDRHRTVGVNFAADRCDPFFNVNTETDLAAAERLFAAGADISSPGISS